MKFLLVLAVLVVAYLLWRNARQAERREAQERAPSPQRPAAAPQDMVCCPVCSVHLPRGEAVTGSDGRLFCSQEHRLTAGQ